jgi:CheY-like chemotaxis protein
MSRADRPLEGYRVLVVEDDYLVAKDLVDTLESAGAEVRGPFGWRDEAIAFVRENAEELDAAILDVNLHGEKDYSVADFLIARSVRVAFATGYGADGLDEKYAGYPRCEKPFNLDALLLGLARND